MLVKSSNELFGPLDPLLAGGELFLHSLDLPWVDNLLTYGETHTHKKKINCANYNSGVSVPSNETKKKKKKNVF